MRPLKPVFRVLAMVKTPQPPAVRVVTLTALFAKPLFVLIITLVTGRALYRDLLVVHTVMALLAESNGVKPYKGKVCNVVVKDHVFTPGALVVAGLAVPAFTSSVNIVFFMTDRAGANFLDAIGLALMTLCASYLAVGVF